VKFLIYLGWPEKSRVTGKKWSTRNISTAIKNKIEAKEKKASSDIKVE
jgi:hypothetical protein